jgi:outer membrane lipoprotein SlyB
MVRLAATACFVLCVAGCGPDYSPNTYAATAVQQANKVEKGVVVGVRQIAVSAQGVVGTATGAAAGGVIGSQAGGGVVTSTFGALGGGLVGGLIGSSVEHAAGDTAAYEYIVRKPNNEMVSVTQKDPVALALGQHVLVISGSQARIVPDYTVNPTTADAPPVTAGSLASPASPPPAPPPAAPPVAPAAATVGPTPLMPTSLDATPPAPSPGTTATEPPPVPVSAAPLPQAAAVAPATPPAPATQANPPAPAAAAPTP